MISLAAGVTVFKRTGRTRQFLNSIDDQPIDTVYVADNGEIPPERWNLYEEDWPFTLEVLDLEYDSGLGYSREQIVEVATEDYLLIADNDMVVPSNVAVILDQLKEKPKYGGISGVLLEEGLLRSGSWDLYEGGLWDSDDVIMLDIRNQKHIEEISGAPLATFDFITNAAIFRMDCLEDYCWDPEFVVEEHLDFYVGHMKQTDWKFGVCPEVLFKHFPGGADDYTNVRDSDDRVGQYRRRCLDKWGYRKRIYMKPYDWISTITNEGRYQRARDAVETLMTPRIRILYDDIAYGRYRP